MNIHCGKENDFSEVNIDCEHFLGGWVNIHCGRKALFFLRSTLTANIFWEVR